MTVHATNKILSLSYFKQRLGQQRHFNLLYQVTNKDSFVKVEHEGAAARGLGCKISQTILGYSRQWGNESLCSTPDRDQGLQISDKVCES